VYGVFGDKANIPNVSTQPMRQNVFYGRQIAQRL